jgi:hypothetical protein
MLLNKFKQLLALSRRPGTATNSGGTNKDDSESSPEQESFWFGLGYSGIAAIAAIGIPLGLWWGLKWFGGAVETMTDAPVMLTLVVISGVIGLLAVLMMAALAFSAVKLADKTQALGLPEGSVRAVIALSLIVIFVITVVFLFAGLNPRPIEVEHLTLEQTTAIPGNVFISKQAEAPPAGAPAPAQQLYTVRRYVEPSKGAEDFAKQIITTISTLVVSISAFYFGSSTAISAQKSATTSSTAPVITKQPSDLSVHADQPAEFSVGATGSNLSYQWQNVTDSGATDIAGATNNTYRIAKVAAADTGKKFACKISNPAGTVTSSVATLTVT